MKDQVKKQIHHLIEKPVKQQLKQPRLLSGVTNKAEADTGDMHNGEDNQEIAKDIGFIEIALILKTFKEETSSNFREFTVKMSEMRSVAWWPGGGGRGQRPPVTIF